AGLTGIQLSAGDGLELDLLDVIVEPRKKGEIFDGIATLPWGSDKRDNARLVTTLLEQHRALGPLPMNLVCHRERISELMKSCLQADNFFAVFDATNALGDEKLDAAMAIYRKGSPTTARVFVEQMRRTKGMSLADMFRMELVIAYQCIRHADFAEGVRALLIDKDKNPNWTYKSALDVPDTHVEAHFVPTWSGAHPLDALGN
ncbi:MAG: hypothetical protein GTO41_28545, partial [Burkholderiales bacterium]|nr:hypothetical protein [Burkholderiales bacterium]